MSKTTPLRDKGSSRQIWYIHRESQVQSQRYKNCQSWSESRLWEHTQILWYSQNRIGGYKCRKIKTFFPQCKLCFYPSCPSPSHSVLLNKCKQQGGLGGMSVTKSSGSLQILQARLTWSRQERWLKDTRCTLLTHSLCLHLSVCFPWDLSILKDCPFILMITM